MQNWNIGVQRSLFDTYVVEIRYVGAAARHLPRNIEANPAVYGPGATAQNADRRRLYANCPADGSACDFSTIAMLRSVARARYDAAQFSVSRRFGEAVGFNVSYWLSKSMDHLSAMNLGGAAARPLAGENDLAQNPFDLEANGGRRCSTRVTGSWRARAGCRASRRAPRRRFVQSSATGSSVASPPTTPARHSRCRIRRTLRCRPTARRSPVSPRAGPI